MNFLSKLFNKQNKPITTKGGTGGVAKGGRSYAKGGKAGEQGEICINGKLYKPDHPEYEKVLHDNLLGKAQKK